MVDSAAIKIGMKPTPPGEFLRTEVFEPLELSLSRAADIMRMRRATLSDQVNGRTALSPEVALRIEKAFGVNMETLLHMQAWHDAYMMRQRAGEIDVPRYTPLLPPRP